MRSGGAEGKEEMGEKKNENWSGKAKHAALSQKKAHPTMTDWLVQATYKNNSFMTIAAAFLITQAFIY